jgi:hypothetical protein
MRAFRDAFKLRPQGVKRTNGSEPGETVGPGTRPAWGIGACLQLGATAGGVRSDAIERQRGGGDPGRGQQRPDGPVLAGVMALSALSGTPGGGVVLGLAYVFGMVFPLFAMALAWDKLHLSERRFGRARPVRLRIAGRTLVTSTVNIAVAVGFVVMAGFVYYLAGAGRMTGGPGFQVAIGRALARVFRRIEVWTAPVPEAVLGLALLALAAIFVVTALHGRHRPDLSPDPGPGLDQHPGPGSGVDPAVAGQPPAPAVSETHPVHAPPGHKAAADHHRRAPVRNQP